WVLCPGEQTGADHVSTVAALARACGAQPVTLTAAEHDRWVALVSHAPHVLANAMAAECAEAPDGALALAGPGLRDVTRIAASEAGLWTEILAANAAPVREVLRALAARLGAAADALEQIEAGQSDAVKRLTAQLESGREGVNKIPGKQGGP